MNTDLKKFDFLLDKAEPAAIVIRQWFRSIDGGVIFPPTYANPSQKRGDPPVYNIDRFGEVSVRRKVMEKLGKVQAFVEAERTEQGVEHSVCTIDSIASQANRIEPAFAGDIAEGKLVPEVVIKVRRKNEEGKPEEEVVNLLSAGHRAADAIVRFSSLAQELEKAIKARKEGDSTPLARIAPTSLVFGMWDSRATGVKVPRLVTSIIRAYDVKEHRRSAQYFPATDYAAAGVIADKGEKLGKKLSDQGMAEVPATFALGGVEVDGEIRRDAVLNLVTLRDTLAIVKNSKGEIDTDKSKEETRKLQRYLLGLALVSLTWFDGKTLNLRQGCQLVGIPDKPLTRIRVDADGAETQFDLDKKTALEYAKQAAEAFGVVSGYEGVFDAKKAKDALKKSASEETE